MRKEVVFKMTNNLLLICILMACLSCAAKTRTVQTSRDVKKPLPIPVKSEGCNFLVFSDRNSCGIVRDAVFSHQLFNEWLACSIIRHSVRSYQLP
jgi:hypothetical protein